MGKTLNEASGTIFMGKNIKPEFNENLLLENLSKKKKEEEELVEAQKILLEAAKQKQKEIDEKIERLELMPLLNKVVFIQYPENPYRKMVTDAGLLIPEKFQFTNPESGQQDTPKDGIVCCKAVEVGPECKYIKEGDDFYLDIRTALPIPFYSLGYKITSEPQILCILNEGLKERLNGR